MVLSSLCPNATKYHPTNFVLGAVVKFTMMLYCFQIIQVKSLNVICISFSQYQELLATRHKLSSKNFLKAEICTEC